MTTRKRVNLSPGSPYHTPDCPSSDRRKWTKALCGVRIDKPYHVLPNGADYPNQCVTCRRIAAKALTAPTNLGD